MGTVTISSVTYTIYGTLAGAEEYLNASLSDAAEAYIADTDARQSKALVMATRFIDSHTWDGAKTSEGQALAFPRTGLEDRDGVEVSSASIPADVINAAYELAALFLDDPSTGDRTTDLNTKKLEAGSAAITYFRPVAGGPFPLVAHRLLAPFMGSSSELALSIGTGLEEESSFDVDDRFDVSNGGY